MYKLPETATCSDVARLLKNAGLNPDGDWYPKHWSDGPGYFVGIFDHRLCLVHGSAPSMEAGEKMWFDSLEEADAWVLACWRMR
jgi:hypothetical protein